MEKYTVQTRPRSSYGTDPYRPKRKRRLTPQQRRRRKRKRMLRKIRAIFILLAMAAAAILAVIGLIKLAGLVFSGFGSKTQTESVAPVSNNVVQTQAQTQTQTQTSASKNSQFTMTKVVYPTKASYYKDITDAEFRCNYAVVLKADTNEVVAGKQPDAKIYPASMTKVMTLVVAVDNIADVNQKVKLEGDYFYQLYLENASVAGFTAGEEVTVKDLLYGLILPSGADAAEALVRLVAGSDEAFAKLMNEKAAQLGLKNSHFTNATGLHNDNHYTTATDMALIFSYALSNETCKQVLSEFKYTTTGTTEHPEGIALTSTMFTEMWGNEAEGAEILGGKTGFTNEAGNCLVSYAKRSSGTYVAVAAKGSGKYAPVFDAFIMYTDKYSK